ncbi:hypothetical protein P7K49_009983 [Saguinus oedipus]|uniref:Uncharacterized protein n=1 Tax=Saguinus oedipus TaxID=9490 RepID=A0ABQ9VLI2_SAGOE|nr:hypothetical protein P7K49_009983 [Saguinus oedipus]
MAASQGLALGLNTGRFLSGHKQDEVWDNVPCGLLSPLPPKCPWPLPEAKTYRDAAPPTSKSSCLQFLIPDDGWDDPQLFSNFVNLLDVFMEKTTQQHMKMAGNRQARGWGQGGAAACAGWRSQAWKPASRVMNPRRGAHPPHSHFLQLWLQSCRGALKRRLCLPHTPFPEASWSWTDSRAPLMAT